MATRKRTPTLTNSSHERLTGRVPHYHPHSGVLRRLSTIVHHLIVHHLRWLAAYHMAFNQHLDNTRPHTTCTNWTATILVASSQPGAGPWWRLVAAWLDIPTPLLKTMLHQRDNLDLSSGATKREQLAANGERTDPQKGTIHMQNSGSYITERLKKPCQCINQGGK